LPNEAPEVQFILYGREGDATLDGAPNAAWRAVDPRGLAWHLATARRARTECDLYFSTISYLTPYFLDRYVQTVFDLIAFKDFAHPHPRARRIERLTARRTLRRAQAILTISHATARDLDELMPELRGKVRVTPLAADERFARPFSDDELAAVRERYALPERFVLATGTIEPRKNLARLVRAWELVPADLREAHALVLAGRRGWAYEPVFEAIAAHPPGAIRHLDFVSDDDLARLYAAATVFCYPSLYEGFGLPVLEAMQAGLAVVASAVPSLREVGGDAVRYVDPYAPEDIAAALEDLLRADDRRAALASAGSRRARTFSWDRTARETMEVLRAVS
jgi:alpha-1,3-rhamnosyl/mannosyltransferase